MPFVDGDLAGDDRRSAAIAFFEDFDEVVTRDAVEGLETPVVYDAAVSGVDLRRGVLWRKNSATPQAVLLGLSACDMSSLSCCRLGPASVVTQRCWPARQGDVASRRDTNDTKSPAKDIARKPKGHRVVRAVEVQSKARRTQATAQMSTFEAAGYLASSLVFAAFCMEGMVRLRAVALASNVAFIVYSIGFGLAPIFLLHAALLPVNTWRLWQAVRAEHRRQMTHTSELRQGVRP